MYYCWYWQKSWFGEIVTFDKIWGNCNWILTFDKRRRLQLSERMHKSTQLSIFKTEWIVVLAVCLWYQHIISDAFVRIPFKLNHLIPGFQSSFCRSSCAHLIYRDTWNDAGIILCARKKFKKIFGHALNIIKHFGPQSLWLLAVGLLDKSFFRWEFFLVESFFIWEFF